MFPPDVFYYSTSTPLPSFTCLLSMLFSNSTVKLILCNCKANSFKSRHGSLAVFGRLHNLTEYSNDVIHFPSSATAHLKLTVLSLQANFHAKQARGNHSSGTRDMNMQEVWPLQNLTHFVEFVIFFFFFLYHQWRFKQKNEIMSPWAQHNIRKEGLGQWINKYIRNEYRITFPRNHVHCNQFEEVKHTSNYFCRVFIHPSI